MQDFLEFTTDSESLVTVTPKKGYVLGSIRNSVATYDIGSESVEQSEEEIACDVLDISGTTEDGRTFQLYYALGKGGNKVYLVRMQASTGDESETVRTLLLSTGVGLRRSVSIDIPNTTVASPITLTWIYVDNDGNVDLLGANARI
jgi:hypothetical protein